MTAIFHEPEVQCDTCEKRVLIKDVGTWYRVATVVATPEHFADLFKAAEANEPIHMHGDFCSLRCLATWATNAAALGDLEAGF